MDQPIMLFPYSYEEFTGIIRNEVREAVKSLRTTESTRQSEILRTRKEAADKLKISLVTLNDWSKRGVIKSYLIGGRVLYKDSELEDSLHLVKTVKC
ncbi:helix-turn-helix domain-containing protein [Rhodonellum sp.]|uniref:helix-turn-helix domain-containing protein n=1 Tax=Rhodonellum sp. TaxID=2231180 RepID=UPI0027286DC1|nr:helix-turn-helix domain-containing protein [Rhodonellum sp.]MDO9553728.1 helix-turn-helix domain-containing protein [Rhodonellum sp.]